MNQVECGPGAMPGPFTIYHSSESIDYPPGQLTIDPSLDAHHRARRDFEHFDDFHFARIEPRQRIHRIIQRHQVPPPATATSSQET